METHSEVWRAGETAGGRSLSQVEVSSRHDWEGALSGLDRVPLQQSWAYGAAMAQVGAGVVRLMAARDGRLVAVAQGLERRFPGGLRLLSVINGPLWARGASEADRQWFLGRLRARYRLRTGAALVIAPDRGGVGDTSRLFRSMGARRVMTGSTTVWLDLTGTERDLMARMSGGWRTALGKASRSGLNLAVRAARASDLEWITQQENAQSDRIGYRGLPAAFIGAFAREAPKDVIFGEARLKGEVVAGALFLRHGPSATYQIGWTGDRGRVLAAQPALIMELIRHLQAMGVRTLDLGGIDTVNAPGVARFKLGLGGEVVQGPGTYF